MRVQDLRNLGSYRIGITPFSLDNEDIFSVSLKKWKENDNFSERPDKPSRDIVSTSFIISKIVFKRDYSI